MKLSIVIVNHNYADFLGTAIRSALDVDGGPVEVIVVDDGSTDDSKHVIGEFEGAVRAILLPKVGQLAATNSGWHMATGDVVIFLDSDDVLPRNVGTELHRAWNPAVSKVQFRMQRIDAAGAPLGPVFPSLSAADSPDELRSWFLRTSAYPTAPGSANAYSAQFLSKIFPIPEHFGHSPDSACLASAPLHGDVVSAPGVVVGYRRHGRNLSNVHGGADMFKKQILRARDRWIFAFDSVGRVADESALRRSRELLQFRVAAHRLDPHEPALEDESAARLMIDVVRSPFQPGPESVLRRAVIALWSLALLATPSSRASRWLLKKRYKF